MKKRNFQLLVIAGLMMAGCSTGKKMTITQKDKELEHFASVLTGNYSSMKQSQSDTSFFNISLKICKIWTDRKDEVWVYVEQALASKMDAPYRQRVYKLGHPSENTYTSEIYTIRNAKDVIGLQDKKEKEQLLTKDMLELKDGCTVVLTYANGIFTGGTQEDKCPSDLRGARYATTRIVLKEGVLESWDQGFDATGKQVWGPTKGGYIFLKE